MLIGSAFILGISDWRTLWLANAMLTVFWAALAFFVTNGWRRRGARGGGDKLLYNVITCFKQRGACLVAACFAMYAAQHISMMAWLPTYMRETYDASTLLAAAVPAIILLFNAGGNWMSAWAMGHGYCSGWNRCLERSHLACRFHGGCRRRAVVNNATNGTQCQQ